MYTNIPPQHQKNHIGFALIAVLFSLVILILLFGSAQKNFLTHTMLIGAQFHKVEQDAVRPNLMALSQIYADTAEPVTVQLDGQDLSAHFQDVGGLVDLNYASPELLELLLNALGLAPHQTSTAILAFRDFRQTGLRLQRVSDFARIARLDPATIPNLANFATVHSGRTGIAPDIAPIILLELLTGTTGSRDFLKSKISGKFHSPASGNLFRVVFQTQSTPQEIIVAIISLSQNSDVPRIVQFQ
ncbi:MAG: hypothetical protein V3V13_13250 [Paracoccaceae bacterium]